MEELCSLLDAKVSTVLVQVPLLTASARRGNNLQRLGQMVTLGAVRVPDFSKNLWPNPHPPTQNQHSFPAYELVMAFNKGLFSQP